MDVRGLVVSAGVVATTLIVGPAHADDPAYRFTYEAPEGCPTEEHARSLVVARLGFDPFVSEARQSVVVHVARERGTLLARVEKREGERLVGARTVRDPSNHCEEIVASAALTSSILIDPSGSLARARVERSQPAPVASSVADDPFARDEVTPGPAPPPSASAALRVFAGARAIVGAGFLPAPSPGVSLDLGVRAGTLTVRAEGRADLEATAPTAIDGARARASLLLGSIGACYAGEVLSLCGVVSAGRVLVASDDLEPSERSQATIAAAGLRPSVSLPLSRAVRWTLTAEGLLPFVRPTVSVRRVEVWTAPTLAVAIGTGLEMQIP